MKLDKIYVYSIIRCFYSYKTIRPCQAYKLLSNKPIKHTIPNNINTVFHKVFMNSSLRNCLN